MKAKKILFIFLSHLHRSLTCLFPFNFFFPNVYFYLSLLPLTPDAYFCLSFSLLNEARTFLFFYSSLNVLLPVLSPITTCQFITFLPPMNVASHFHLTPLHITWSSHFSLLDLILTSNSSHTSTFYILSHFSCLTAISHSVWTLKLRQLYISKDKSRMYIYTTPSCLTLTLSPLHILPSFPSLSTHLSFNFFCHMCSSGF